MATVFKRNSTDEQPASPQGVTGLAGFNLDDLADQGRKQIAACQEKCNEMLEQAKRDAEQLRAEAERKGYEEGLSRAEKDFDQKLQEQSEAKAKSQLALLHSGAQQVRDQYQAWLEQYADALNTVALSAAERLVGDELQRRRELLVGWTKEALQSTRSAATLTVAVHPETLAELGESLDKLLASPEFPEQTHVEADESVDRTEVIVRQPGGDIQAGLLARMDRLREMLS